MCVDVDGGRGITVKGMLANDLHDAHDARSLAIGMVEESEIALLHSAHVVLCCGRSVT